MTAMTAMTVSLMIGLPLSILAAAAALFMYRLLVGPTVPDRVIALDGLLAAVLAGILVGAADRNNSMPIVAVLLVALVGFVATGALAGDTWNVGVGEVAILDGIATAFLVAGALLTLLAGVGVVRFPDVTSRMHAAAKAPVLGIMFCGIGVVFAVRTVETAIIVVLVIVLQLIASPVGSHLLARSVYHRLHPHIDGVDDLAAAQSESESDSESKSDTATGTERDAT